MRVAQLDSVIHPLDVSCVCCSQNLGAEPEPIIIRSQRVRGSWIFLPQDEPPSFLSRNHNSSPSIKGSPMPRLNVAGFRITVYGIGHFQQHHNTPYFA